MLRRAWETLLAPVRFVTAFEQVRSVPIVPHVDADSHEWTMADFDNLTEAWDVKGESYRVLKLKGARTATAPRCDSLVFVMLPGNPGVPHFYLHFLHQVHRRCPEIDIYCPQHLGHCFPVSSPRLFTLNDQIKHKLDFMERLMTLYPPSTKFIIAGHSVGAYISLKLLELMPNTNQIDSVYFLFPTLEHIKSTPNGIVISKLVISPLRQIGAGSIEALRWISGRHFNSIIQYLSNQPSPYGEITCDKLLRYSCMTNALYMAHCEFGEILDLNVGLIGDNIDKLTFYYGCTDQWAPMAHYEKIKELFPKGRVLLCKDNLPHAFVLGFGDIMAKTVAGWIQKQ